MKLLAALALFAAPAVAQTLPAVPKCTATNVDCIEKRADVRGVRGDVYTGRAAAEYKAEDADRALVLKLRPPVVPPVVVTPPVHAMPPVVIVPPVVTPMPPMSMSNVPFIDNSKIPAPSVGYSSARIKPETFDISSKNTDGTGQFRTVCDFSHMSYDDPIVFPGKQGAAHLHAFFGGTGINYATTAASILTGNSTCSGGTANRTGYWVPAIIDTKDGTPLKPSKMVLYYKSDFLPGASTKPYPAGLRMVAGDMRSTVPQERTDWGCSAPNGTELVQGSKSIPTNCPAGYTIINTIEFPMCWNGVDLDSDDHKSHMAFTVWNNDSRKVECPKTHPVQLPTLTQKVQYIVTDTTARWRLASDNYGTDKPGGYSTHADWFNGWDAKVQEIWVKNCLQAGRDCHGFLLGDGTSLF